MAIPTNSFPSAPSPIPGSPAAAPSTPQAKFGLGRGHRFPGSDQFDFGASHQSMGRPGYSTGDRIGAGIKEALKPSALIKGAIKSTIFTLPFMILPGSQLVLIPAFMAVGAAMRFMKAFRHPARYA